MPAVLHRADLGDELRSLLELWLPRGMLRNMSIEKETKRSIRWMTFWRVATAVSAVPEDAFDVLAQGMYVGKNIFRELSKALYGLEQEHARRYYALTGLDPARADGDESRYQEIRIAAGDEKRPDFDEDEDD